MPVERIQRRDLPPRSEYVATLGQPGLVRLPRAARDHVQQRSVHPAVLVAGRVDRPGQLLRTPPALVYRLGGHVVPHVLVEDSDALYAGLIRGRRGQESA